MTSLDLKADLHPYLRDARETLVWKPRRPRRDDIRRPLTPTGTNLLGLVKHTTATPAVLRRGVRPAPGHVAVRGWRGAQNRTLTSGQHRTRGGMTSSPSPGAPGRSPTQPSTSSPLDAVGRVRWWGDAPSLSTVSSCTPRRRHNAMPATPTSSESWSRLSRPAQAYDNLRISDPAGRSALRDRIEARLSRWRRLTFHGAWNRSRRWRRRWADGDALAHRVPCIVLGPAPGCRTPGLLSPLTGSPQAESATA